jgi:predicted HTH domain antitoxin
MFKDYHISSAKAADFAGLSLIEFRQELAKRDICVNYDVADFQLELQTLNRLGDL